ncbi:hypothetical protein [Bosea sp. BH3]|uniref:hypothetical protein n=1 Tax=Bosea sp. BH3 TaxID=2871701 RepID=UPI0021CB33D8|nr:hypothetical protein [Bosea sp. BH3]MCU4180694.1 hypothetical protein [Bosea sp. BH3]
MALTPEALNLISLGLGIAGFACLAGPVIMRMGGRAAAEPPGSGKILRSPLWWAGFVMTVAAIMLQRVAAQGAAG